MKVERDYQVSLRKQAGAAMIKDKWVIVQSPTGSGKSFIMFNIIMNGLKKGKTFLVLTESKKIFKQLVEEFNAHKINSKTKYFALMPGRVYVAMSQSLANRPRIIQAFLDLGDKMILLIDEAHIGTTRKVIECFPGYRLGFTATPAYRWAKFLPEVYNNIVCGLQVEELIARGALMPYRHIGRKLIDNSDLKKKGGEYTEASQEVAFGKTQVYAGLYEDLKVTPYKVGMVYVASIKQCNEVWQNLKDLGYNVARFHSELEDPDAELDRFENDPDCNLMVSVAALTKGYDNPLVDLVVLFRATTSLPLYLQMVGRGGRPLFKDEHKIAYAARNNNPQITEKRYFTCLDYGGNFDRFRGWDSNRDWATEWLPGAPRDKDAAPVKECPSCESYVTPSARICKWCGYEWPEIIKELAIGDLVDFKAEDANLIGRLLSDLNPKELAQYSKSKNAGNKAIRIATAQRQLQKWEQANEMEPPEGFPNFLREFADAMGYAPKWVGVRTSEIKKYEMAARDKALRIAEEEAGHAIDPKGFEFDFKTAPMRYYDHIIS